MNICHKTIWNWLILAGLLLASPVVWSAEECLRSNLIGYKITFLDRIDKKSYVGEILLPDIKKAGFRFCGYWRQAYLTGNEYALYTGHSHMDSITINLRPGLMDAGSRISLSNKKQWIQEGAYLANAMGRTIPLGRVIIASELVLE